MAQKKRIRTRSQIPMIVTGAHYWFDTLQNHFHVCSKLYIPSTINTDCIFWQLKKYTYLEGKMFDNFLVQTLLNVKTL